jgi:hypothetical protein
MSSASTTSSPQPPLPTTVNGNLPCRRCSYNLRTLSTLGSCPECSAPVHMSLQPELICWSDPAWAAKLALAMRLIFLGVIPFFISDKLARFPSLLGRWQIGLFLQAAGTLLISGGFWLLATPDPSGIGEAEYGWLRKASRFVAGLWLLEGFVSSILEFCLPSLPLYRLLYLTAGGPAGLAGLLGLAAPLRYLGKLAQRIPDDALARRAFTLSFLLPITLCLFRISFYFFFAFPLLRRSPAVWVMLGILFVLAFTASIFAWRTIAIVNRLAKALRRQAELSESAWTPFSSDPGSGTLNRHTTAKLR